MIYTTGDAADFSMWTLAPGWSAANGLSSTGEDGGGWALPPITVTETSDYAAEIDFILEDSDRCPRNFGIAIRGSDTGYYAAGIEWDCDAEVVLWAGQDRLESSPISLDSSSHTLRIEAVGDRIAVSIDGQLMIETTDSTYPTGEELGIWTNGVPLSVTTFRIYDLSDSPNGG